MSSRVRNAANGIADGDNGSAVALLTGVLRKDDGEGRDWLHGSPELAVLAASLPELIALLM